MLTGSGQKHKKTRFKEIEMRDFEAFIKHLVSQGFNPRTVIDVGVAWGTKPLYVNFQEAYFILVEALPYFEDEIKKIITKYGGEYHIKGAADKRASKTILVRKDAMSLAGTNILEGAKSGDYSYDVEIDRLDSIIDLHRLKEPVLLKLDVQGADLRALKGAKKLLKQTEVVIAEASLFNNHNLVFDIMQFMRGMGFELYEIFGANYRPYDGAMGQVDIAFVRSNSPLISYKKWA